MGGALSEFEFSYRLTGTGWSEARIAIGSDWVLLRASYLSDALGDLLEAVEQLNSGATSARVSWEEEPGEHRWLLDRDRDAVDARLLWFDDQYDELPDEKGRERLAGRVGLEAFTAAVVVAASKVLVEHGEGGYREQWIEHPFPTATLEALRKDSGR